MQSLILHSVVVNVLIVSRKTKGWASVPWRSGSGHESASGPGSAWPLTLWLSETRSHSSPPASPALCSASASADNTCHHNLNETATRAA